MSRIGKNPVVLPEGVTASVDGQGVTVKGPKGELSHTAPRDIGVRLEDGALVCHVVRNTKQTPALWGTTRAILANMAQGVSEGFQKKLELHGVGYRAAMKGKDLELSLGYSHPVVIQAPEGITFAVDKDGIVVEGIDAYRVGQVAADIRATRPPEPYKGKGVRYAGEQIRRKVGKVVGSAG
jgi:large subunit ribosomal protein L6